MTLHPIRTSMATIFLIVHEGRCVLVDTGLELDAPRVLAAVRKLSQGAEPLAIFLTHAHVDHAGAAKRLREAWRCPVVAPSLEADWLREGIRHVPPAIAPGGHWMRWAARVYRGPRLPAFEPDVLHTLEDPWDWSEWGFPVQTLATPGHSPGHVSLVSPGEWVVTGDALASSPVQPDRPGIGILGEDLGQMWRSARALEALDVPIFWPSHGKPFDRSSLTSLINEGSST